MLTVLVGLDKGARAKRLEALLAPRVKNGEDVRTYTDVNFSMDEIHAVAGNSSLFGGTFVYVITGVGDNADGRDMLESLIPELAGSPHQFILSENALLAPFLKKVETKKGTVEKFDLKDKPKKAHSPGRSIAKPSRSASNRANCTARYSGR